MSEHHEEPVRESHVRSVIKGFTWRIIATSTTFAISYLLISFGSENAAASAKAFETAGWIAACEFVVKIFIYYLHERIWQLAPRGTVRRLIGSNDESSNESTKDD